VGGQCKRQPVTAARKAAKGRQNLQQKGEKPQEGECSLHLTVTSYRLRQFEQPSGCLEVASVEDESSRRRGRGGPGDRHGMRHLAESPATDSQPAVVTLGIKMNTAAVCFLSDINALCRLVHRVNLTHSTNHPHARRHSGEK